MKQITCPKCSASVVSDGYNLLDDLGGVLVSHALGCDWRGEE